MLGLVEAGAAASRLLTLRQPPDERKFGPMASFEAWILEEMVLRPVLGEGVARHVTWIHDAAEAVASLKDGRNQMALLLKPLPMDLFETIVGRGERLPRKSTFFYPKLPTGLVINRLDSQL